MHLTSTPNTIQTEIGLASQATIQRTVGNTDPNALICCAQYGQPHRNSDPQIGRSANVVVGTGKTITLANPPGLYIQSPDFTQYTTPDGADASQYWTIARGQAALNDADGNPLPGNFILHAVFEVPTSAGYTVSDIKINGQAIAWAGQIIQTITMHILADGLPATTPAAMACVGNPATVLAQPLQLFHANVFNAMNGTVVKNPVQQAMTLVSNSTLIAPLVKQGSQSVPMILTVALPGAATPLPQVSFDDPNIVATVTSSFPVTYAVPGNTYPSDSTALVISVNVGANVATGLHGAAVAPTGQKAGPFMPALLNVVSA
jgi:hypothetical protein